MTGTRLAAIGVLLALTDLAGCSGAPAKAPDGSPRPAAASTQAATAAPATAAADSGTVTGSVAETMNSGGYTYVRLQTGKSDVWIAASEFQAKVGDRLTVPLEMPMPNFHSQSLNRDFPLIYFVSKVAPEGVALSTAHGQPAAPAMHGGSPSASAAAGPVEHIAPAPGGHSIADVWAKRKSLAGKEVLVRGKVTKFNGGILGRNWVHLQDGSGSAADGTNDLVVTTDATVKVGDVVTMSGVLALGIDIGAGYAYDALLEKAVVK